MMELTSVFIIFLSTGLLDSVQSKTPDDVAQKENSLKVAIEDFTQDTYNHLAISMPDKNFVFSPLSLHSALSMVYFGTTDNRATQSELQVALGGLVGEQLVKKLYKNLVKDYNNRKSIFYGNHLWVANGFNLKEDYESLIKEHMNAKLSTADFNSAETTDVVNKWVENLTNGKIKKLVEGFNLDTQMFLANASYFKENWRFPFDVKNFNGSDLEADFRYQEEESTPLKMMQLISSYIQYEEFDLPGLRQGFSLIRIPYENKNFEMKIILPKTTGRKLDLKLLETYLKLTINMDQTREKNILRVNTTKGDFAEVDLMMPKFTVRTKFQAKDLFQDLGAKKIFTPDAEMNKITDDGPLGIGDILHETVVEVTKDGTEGAAATGVEIVFFSSSVEDTKKVVVNKPFIFIVQDKTNDIPLMIGRVVDPFTL